MKRKRNFQTSIYLALRHMGMLCKAPKPEPRKLKLAMTIHADGSITKYDGPIDAVPVNTHSLESEVGAFLADKKISKPGCKFDVSTQSCICGKNISEFLTQTCKQ
jgi:hypothetical protein